MARLSVYDPFAEVFPEIFRGLMQPARATSSDVAEIRVEVVETAQHYQVQAELAGVKKEDINVQVDGNRVSINAEVRREAQAQDGERVLRSERFYGAMARSFVLGSELDEQAVQARFDNGVLTLTLPKKQPPAARRITIQ
jgi:HSP20 family protein